MRGIVRIVVRGIPASQGSKRHVGNGIMVESSRAVGPWREAVRAETQRAMNGQPPIKGALLVDVGFALPRPKSLAKRIRYPSKRPDLDKLVRAVLDGVTAGGAWADDAQVAQLFARKSYADPEGSPGCVIRIQRLEES